MAGKDGEMFMTRTFNVTPKTTEQHLIARSDKSVAYVTNNKRLYTRHFVLLKLTTDRHKASCGLFATAELLFIICYYISIGRSESKVKTEFIVNLSLVKPDGVHDSLNGAVQVGRVKYDDWRFTTKFERQLLSRPGGQPA